MFYAQSRERERRRRRREREEEEERGRGKKVEKSCVILSYAYSPIQIVRLQFDASSVEDIRHYEMVTAQTSDMMMCSIDPRKRCRILLGN